MLKLYPVKLNNFKTMARVTVTKHLVHETFFMSPDLNNSPSENIPVVSAQAFSATPAHTTAVQEPLLYVVEDDRANNFLCKMTLEEVGITNVRSFLRADLALADLQEMVDRNEAFPSIILLDINMPAMDGWGFLGEFKNFPEEAKAKTVVYLFSTSDHPRDVEKAKYHPEVSSFLLKPLSEDDANYLKEKYSLIKNG